MGNEVEHLPAGASVMAWAVGYIVFSYTERMRSMIHSRIRIAPWVLTLEMLLCFVPLTWLFFATVIATRHGVFPARDAFLYMSASVLGPLGLGVAFANIFVKRRAGHPLLALLLLLSAWTIFSYTGQVLHNGTGISNWWRDWCLIALLPALASLHLTLLDRGLTGARPLYANA